MQSGQKLERLNYDIDRYQRQMDDLAERHKIDITLDFQDLIKESPWKYIFKSDPRDKYGRPAPYTNKEIIRVIDSWYADAIKRMQSQLSDYNQTLKELTAKSTSKRKRSEQEKSTLSPKQLTIAKFVLIPFNPKTGEEILNESPVIVPNDGTPIKIGRPTWLNGKNTFISREAVEVHDAQNGYLIVSALRSTIKARPSSQSTWQKMESSAHSLTEGSQVLLLQDVLGFKLSQKVTENNRRY